MSRSVRHRLWNDHARRRCLNDWRRRRRHDGCGWGRSGLRRNWRNHGLRGNRRRYRRPNWRRGNCFLLLGNRPQHITRTGDVRQINLGFDFFFAAQRARGTRRGALRFSRAADVGPHFFCFVVLK